MPTLLIREDGEVLHFERSTEPASPAAGSGGVSRLDGWFTPASNLALRNAIAACKLGMATRIPGMPLQSGQGTDWVDLHVWPALREKTAERHHAFVGILHGRRHDDARTRRIVQHTLSASDDQPQHDPCHWALVDNTGHTLVLSAAGWSSFLTPLAWAGASVALDREFEPSVTPGAAPARSLLAAMNDAGAEGLSQPGRIVVQRAAKPDETWVIQWMPIALKGMLWGHACRLAPLSLLPPPPQVDIVGAFVEQHERRLQRMSRAVLEPLDAIRGFVDLLLLSPDPRLQPDFIREAVGIASKRIQTALAEATSAEKRTALSRIESTEMPLRHGLQMAAHQVRQDAGDKGVDLQGVPEWVRVVANEPALTAVFVDLLAHALRCTPAGGQVQVQSRPSPQPGRLALCIRAGASGSPQQHVSMTSTWAAALANALQVISRMSGHIECFHGHDGAWVVIVHLPCVPQGAQG